LDTALFECGSVKLYFGFMLPATVNTSFVAVKLDEDSSKASLYVIHIFPDEAISSQLWQVNAV